MKFNTELFDKGVQTQQIDPNVKPPIGQQGTFTPPSVESNSGISNKVMLTPPATREQPVVQPPVQPPEVPGANTPTFDATQTIPTPPVSGVTSGWREAPVGSEDDVVLPPDPKEELGDPTAVRKIHVPSLGWSLLKGVAEPVLGIPVQYKRPDYGDNWGSSELAGTLGLQPEKQWLTIGELLDTAIRRSKYDDKFDENMVNSVAELGSEMIGMSLPWAVTERLIYNLLGATLKMSGKLGGAMRKVFGVKEGMSMAKASKVQSRVRGTAEVLTPIGLNISQVANPPEGMSRSDMIVQSAIESGGVAVLRTAIGAWKGLLRGRVKNIQKLADGSAAVAKFLESNPGFKLVGGWEKAIKHMGYLERMRLSKQLKDIASSAGGDMYGIRCLLISKLDPNMPNYIKRYINDIWGSREFSLSQKRDLVEEITKQFGYEWNWEGFPKQIREATQETLADAAETTAETVANKATAKAVARQPGIKKQMIKDLSSISDEMLIAEKGGAVPITEKGDLWTKKQAENFLRTKYNLSVHNARLLLNNIKRYGIEGRPSRFYAEDDLKRVMEELKLQKMEGSTVPKGGKKTKVKTKEPVTTEPVQEPTPDVKTGTVKGTKIPGEGTVEKLFQAADGRWWVQYAGKPPRKAKPGERN